MPQLLDTGPVNHAPRVAIRPSLVVELEWSLSSGVNPEFLADHPTLARAYADDPDLHERVVGFWGPEEATSCPSFFEVLVLAHRGGLLFSMDPDELLGGMADLCAMDGSGFDEYAFLSETEQDAEMIRRRLAILRHSSSRRRRYVSLLRDVWTAVGGAWSEFGRPAVDAAIAARRHLQAGGADWREVSRSDCDLGSLLDHTVGSLGPDGEVVVVPAFFTHRGLLLDLPGVVVIGVRADTTEAEARARTDALAHQLKALSDPTRLALVDALRRGPRTVTELSSSFSLAQPTVSNHVKVLREAGFVTDRREGTRRLLRIEEAAVAELVDTLRVVLTDGTP
jgi:DNA-binding transcriptional ArsR family regulator